jgi:hypothetical protein
MKCRPILFALSLVAVSAASVAATLQAKSSHYVDRLYGFQIAPPAFSKIGPAEQMTRAIFFAQAVEGFSPNVSVAIQRVATTRDQFVTQSRAQFQAMQVEVTKEEDKVVDGCDAVVWEYAGEVASNVNLQFLAMAVIAPQQVYVITCTAPKSRFEQYESDFRACLDSFTVKLPK